MKYALFRGDNYYPAGGMDDFVGLFNSIEEAKGNDGGDWAQIASVPDMKLVAYRDGSRGWQSDNG